MSRLRTAAGAVRRFLAEVRTQLRATTWPTRRAAIGQSAIVLTFLVAMVALIGGADAGLSAVMLAVFG